MTLVQKAIIKKGNKYLILLRPAHAKYFPSHWDLPGGKLELNEDPHAGIIREVKEETDLDVRPVDVLGVYDYDLDNAGKITHRITLYSTEVLAGEVKISDEHTQYRWATQEEIPLFKSEPYFTPFFEQCDAR